jgi:hypothetical protein
MLLDNTVADNFPACITEAKDIIDVRDRANASKFYAWHLE